MKMKLEFWDVETVFLICVEEPPVSPWVYV